MRQRGFTLIEILLSIALIGILAGLSAPVYERFQLHNDLQIARDATMQGAARAQLLAQSGYTDAAWSLRVQEGHIIVFQGDDFSSRDSAYDEVFSIAATIQISGTLVSGSAADIHFAAVTGLPDSAGSIVLTNPIGRSHIIDINSFGLVEY